MSSSTALPFVEIDDREICPQRASAVGSARMPDRDRKQAVERALPMGHENYILVDAISGKKTSRSRGNGQGCRNIRTGQRAMQ